MPKKVNISSEQLTFCMPNTKECSLKESKIFTKQLFAVDENFYPEYIRTNGALFLGDSLHWLEKIRSDSIDMIFADPPYNINKADWDKFDSQEDYINWSMKWIYECARILKADGSLFICGFSEILADLKHPSMKYFAACKWLVWHYKNKANLGNDWGRSHESILHLRKTKKFLLNIDAIRIPYAGHTLKYPVHPQAETSQYSKNKNSGHAWTPNPLGAKPKDVLIIPTICNGMTEKTDHPTQKPEELLRKMVLASSKEGDIILDPFSGSGTTLVVAEQLNRLWIGCDKSKQYNEWAIDRIDNVKNYSIKDWIEFDKNNLIRREKLK